MKLTILHALIAVLLSCPLHSQTDPFSYSTSALFVQQQVVKSPGGEYFSIGYKLASSEDPVRKAVITKFSSDGQLQWCKGYASTVVNQELFASPFAFRLIATNDALYWLDIGTNYSAEEFQSQLALNKVDLDGQLIWSRRIVDPFEAFPSWSINNSDLYINASGNPVVVFNISPGFPVEFSTDFRFIEYSSTGDFLNYRVLDNPFVFEDGPCLTLSASNDFPAVIIHSSSSNLIFQTIVSDYILENRKGIQLWGDVSSAMVPTDAVRCSNGDVAVVGFITNPNSSLNVGAFVRFGPTGTVLSARYFNGNSTITSVIERPDGRLWINGYNLIDNIQADNGFIALLSSDGEIESSKTFIEEVNWVRTNYSQSALNGLGLFVPFSRSSWDGLPILNGFFSVDENGTGICPGFQNDNFELLFATDPSLFFDSNVALSVGNLTDFEYISGDYLVSDVNLGLTNACGSITSIDEEEPNFSVYPNPVKEILNIQTSSHTENWTIYSAEGRLVMQGDPFGSDFTSIEVSKLHPGIYFLEFHFTDGKKKNTLFIKD